MKTWKMTFVAIIAILGLVGFVGLSLTSCGGNDDSPQTYTVTFNSNGGSAVSSITGIESGATIEKPSDPTKEAEGYSFTFDGWYKDNTTFANAWNFTTDTVTANITLYAKWTITFTYELGDEGPGGGKVFYISSSGFIMTDTNEVCHYLEAAPTNMDTGLGLAWASSAFISPADGGTGAYVNITGTETAIGTGRKNTALILATDADAPAAKACNEYTNNGKNDWFLPSKDELNELYKSKDSVGNLAPSWHWSSSQDSNSSAWELALFDGSDESSVKYDTAPVRAVRAF